jgi:3-hydroxypropanoate dehydrogenase
MTSTLSKDALDLIFRKARSHNVWLPEPVSDDLLRRVYDLAKWGPTSANSSPMRVVFVKSKEAKARLLPALSATNAAKTEKAPVCAIVAYDTQFYEFVPKLFAHNPDAITWFKGPGKEQAAAITALRNGTLQGAYLMIAARAFGLDCGPMSGFDNAKVDAAFFPDGRCKSNFLCSLGYGDAGKLMPRNPRLSFEEACAIV